MVGLGIAASTVLDERRRRKEEQQQDARRRLFDGGTDLGQDEPDRQDAWEDAVDEEWAMSLVSQSSPADEACQAS